MEYNERNITAVEVYKKLEEVEKQNKEILEKTGKYAGKQHNIPSWFCNNI